MNNQNLAKGIALIAIALAFGLPSLRYPMGNISSAGPGLFPIVMSCTLLVIGIAVIVRSHFITKVPLTFTVRNIALVSASLAFFAAVSTYVNMTAGIVVLVFCATYATSGYSWKRNLKVSAALIAVGFAFLKFLGLQLPML